LSLLFVEPTGFPMLKPFEKLSGSKEAPRAVIVSDPPLLTFCVEETGLRRGCAWAYFA